MAATFKLEVLTPERNFFNGDVEMLVLKTPEGEIGILSGHVPLVTAVASGSIRILQNGKWLEGAITSGFMEITRNKTVVLVDTAEWPDEIDQRRAEAARLRALERLHQKLSHVEYLRTEAALSRAVARLKVKKDIKHS